MKSFRRVLAMILAAALLLCCAVTGLVLPASAEGDTFKLGADEYYIAPSLSSSLTVYGAVSALTLDGKPYEEELTWTSDNTDAVGISATYPGVFYSKIGVSGTAVVTATNAAGESHSCTVHVVFDGERMAGGDFETPASNIKLWTSKLIKDGAATIIEEDGNHVLHLPAGTGIKYLYNIAIDRSKNYLLTFDYKCDAEKTQAGYLAATKTTNFDVRESSGWERYSYAFTSKSSGSRESMLGFRNNATEGSLYLDNFSLIEVGTAESIALNTTEATLEIGDALELNVVPTPADATFNRAQWTTDNAAVATVDKNGKVTAVGAGTATITATSYKLTATCTVTVNEAGISVTPDEELENGEITFDEAAEDVQQGDVVTVTVTPEEGYLMVPGSLRYVNKAGETVRVLNKDFEGEATFGQGDGNTFKMVMPDEKVTLTADFVSVDEQNFAANTIGTACRYTLNEQDEKEYDGIRFLTRLNLANKFDTEGEKFTVTYGGTEYTVLELGSLLKRTENDTALTYDNAVANEQTTGASRMWVSRAYSNASGAFKLVDYTESYIDFTSVMVTSHIDRSYTARGYIRMQAADETIVTLEFDELTNSISGTAEKL